MRSPVRGISASVRFRLAALVLVALVPAFVAVCWSAAQQRERERARMESMLLRRARLATAALERSFEEARLLLASLARRPEVQALDRAETADLCRRALLVHLTLSNVGVVAADGSLVASARSPEESVLLSDRTWFKRALEGRRFAAGRYQVEVDGGRPVLVVGWPIVSGSPLPVGVAFAAIEIAWLVDAVAVLREPEVEAEFFLVDVDGTVLGRFPTPAGWVGQPHPGAPLLPAAEDAAERVHVHRGPDGRETLSAFTVVRAGGEPVAGVGASLPTAALYRAADHAQRQALGSLGVAAILALLASLSLGTSWFVHPVRALVRAVRAMGAGNLDARVRDGAGPGEFGELARAFDDMAASLGARAQELTRLNEEISRHANHMEEEVAGRTAALQAANAEWEAFAYSVSHDLRAPLRAIDGLTQALLEDYGPRLDDTGREYARRAVAAARRLDVLIQDLLAYSRLGRMQLSPGPVSLDAIVRATAESLDEDVRRRGGSLTVEPGLPGVVAHPPILGQIVANLVGNALKFLAPGVAPQVRVGATRQDRVVRLWVEDNGIGIAPHHHERIFRVFERLHGPEEFPGTGIGLAIVRRGAERMGGRAGVESIPGRGSRFWVDLPASEGPA